MTKPVRVRFAPSPTGYLHVGGARTALYNYLFAKHHGGQFILRIEDTDLERSTEESMQMQIGDLKWLNLKWDEGPNSETFVDEGPYGPYRQSRRLDIYLEHANRLLAAGKAYYDFRTDAELDAEKQKSMASGRPHQVEAPEHIVPVDEARARIAKGEKAAIRYKVGVKRDYVLSDLIRNQVTFPSDMVGDFVCIRSNGMPVYNFCCAIDDALMKISHVFRAEEHLSNTLRQMMLYEAFGYEMPQFGHLSIILGPDRQKLSKRKGATSCNDFKERGYLPDALSNFILLLGWSSAAGKEIMSREEMTARFNPAAAVFDDQKLEWMNATHLRALSNDELWAQIQPFMLEKGIKPEDLHLSTEMRDRALELFKTSMTTLADAPKLLQPLVDSQFALDDTSREVFGWPEAKMVWQGWKKAIESHSSPSLTEAEFASIQDSVKVSTGAAGKKLFQTIRVAVIGQPQGAELKVLVPLISKASLLKRVGVCLAKV
jgi:nondiscriminating glutamyl-tRNA synthetase